MGDITTAGRAMWEEEARQYHEKLRKNRRIKAKKRKKGKISKESSKK